MKIISTNEAKIFLTFFILFSFFVHWAGWNEESKLETNTFANTADPNAVSTILK